MWDAIETVGYSFNLRAIVFLCMHGILNVCKLKLNLLELFFQSKMFAQILNDGNSFEFQTNAKTLY